MNIQTIITNKQEGTPNEEGYVTTYVDVTYIFDEYSNSITIPIFNVQSEEEVLIGVNNMCITQFRIYQNSL